MKSLGLASFLLVAVSSATALTVGCSSSDGTPSKVDGGVIQTGDAATCGKLPPTGPQQIVPPSTDPDVEIGENVAFRLDKAGRPFFAWMNENSGAKTYELMIQTWDDCAGAWRTPVKIDDKIYENSRSLSISVDASDGRIAVGYAKTIHVVMPPRQNDTVAAFVAISTDNGLTFTPQKVSDHAAEHDDTEGDINDVDHVRVALGGGKTYLAYGQDYQACKAGGNECKGGAVLATANGAAFTYELIKDGVDTERGGALTPQNWDMGLAIDSAGVPAVALHIEPQSGYNTVLHFWRPGTNGVKITDSSGQQNDDGDVTLAFDGTAPRVAYRLQIDSQNTFDVSFSSSTDGQTWAAPVRLPKPEHITYSQNIVASGGKVWIFAGGPHVFTSSDLTTFAVNDLDLAQTSGSVTGAVDASGKFWVGLEGVTPKAESHGGVVLYREP